MKNLLLIFAFFFTLVSCKENVINGFTSRSVKEDVISNLNGSEWKANANDAYYPKISFDNKVIVLTTRGGGEVRAAFEVTNVASPTPVLPDTIQLRLKSGLLLDEIYLTDQYKGLRSVVRTDVNSTFTGESTYKREK